MSFYGVVRSLFYPAGRYYFGMKVEGIEHVPRSGPAIIAANHVSWLDPAIVGCACPRPVRFLIAKPVYEKAWSRWFYSGMRAIPVAGASRDTGSLRSALRALGGGELVGVFPEGRGLTRVGVRREAKPGALLLGALSGAPFVPVALMGTLEAWPPGRRLPRPGSVTVRFGEPYQPLAKGARPDREHLRCLAEDLMDRIRDMAGTPA